MSTKYGCLRTCLIVGINQRIQIYIKIVRKEWWNKFERKKTHRIKYKTRGQNTNLNELLVRFGGDLQNAWDRNALKGIEKNLIFIWNKGMEEKN